MLKQTNDLGTESDGPKRGVRTAVKPPRPTVPAKLDNAKHKAFAPVGSLFAGYQLEDAGGYITREFQDYGYRLALALDDLPHKSLYIKMAKEIPRGLLERALSYVSDAAAVKSKAKLFMWRLRQLQQTATDANSDSSA